MTLSHPMGKSKHVIGHNSKSTVTRQIGHFIIHLRWHYQVFILSSGFLLGGYFSTGIDWPTFLVQFANVHLLLFGGATAYNSYWDQDCGPVGGLKHPPPMRRWMWTASLFLQIAGLFIASFEGLVFALIYLTSMTFYWLYSTPHFRWKAHPSRSFAAIGLSSGVAPLLLGYLAAGNVIINYKIWIAAFGTALILLSLYPISQLYQQDEDRARNDQTFALTYGLKGVILFFGATFTVGLLITGACIYLIQPLAGLMFVTTGIIAGIWIYRRLSSSKTQPIDYTNVMRIKYTTALAFESFIILLISIKHIG